MSRTLRRIRALPGVESAGTIDDRPSPTDRRRVSRSRDTSLSCTPWPCRFAPQRFGALLLGIAVGTAGALASAKVLKTLVVFGVSASDPLTLATAGAALAVLALMASVAPLYRALRLDPVQVLRAD